jgi:tRNA G37 N-methylase Trm5
MFEKKCVRQRKGLKKILSREKMFERNDLRPGGRNKSSKERGPSECNWLLSVQEDISMKMFSQQNANERRETVKKTKSEH